MSRKRKGKGKNQGKHEKRHNQEASQPDSIRHKATGPTKKEKRTRQESKKNDGHSVAVEVVGLPQSQSVVPYVVQWLNKRKIEVPDALMKPELNYSNNSIDQLIRLIPSLRERERRALSRHVTKCIQNNGCDTTKATVELQDSDGEYDIEEPLPPSRPQNDDLNTNDEWPKSVKFSNNYRWDPTVPNEVKDEYCPNIARPRSARFSRKVYFRRITDPDHPAYDEFGLFCALPNGAPPGTWLLDYVGHITLGKDQDKTSDYASDFGVKSELSCDANHFGNEARYINDFRNTGKHPNVEFNYRRDKNGELRQGVYVKTQKGFEGIQQHEELLISYGKSYWRGRVGNMTDFVWRLPGQPMPKGGKPPLKNQMLGGEEGNEEVG